MKLLRMAAVLAAIGFASSASAEIVTVTYTGTVYESGILDSPTYTVAGQGAGDVVGEAFTSTYTYDVTGGGTYYASGHSPSSPVTSATVTVGDQTLTIPTPLYYSEIDSGGNNYYVEAIYQPTIPSVYEQVNAVSTIGYNGQLIPLGQSFTTNYVPGSQAGQQYQDFYFNNATGQGDINTEIYANVSTMTVAASGIPEPSTWAMMLLGFAGLGYAGFRARRTALPTL